MNQFFDYRLLGNKMNDWLICLAIITACITAARIIKSIVLARLRKVSERSKSTLDDFAVTIIERSAVPFLYIVGVYFGLRYLDMSNRLSAIIHGTLMAVTVFFIIRLISDFISYSIERFMKKESSYDVQVRQAKGILLFFKIVLWILGAVFLIDNLGYDITTIIAGLGIGGIAIALAAQAVLGDLFSYLVIFFDKPFEIGDFIIIGDKMGTVEYIGIKTTRLRALGGEQLVVSNTDLTNSRVQNYKRMEKRRVAFMIGVTYETSREKLKQIPQIAADIVSHQPDAQFDRAHFASFGDFNLNFEIVYYILSSDYNMYMDTQQAINLALFEAFEQNGIGFAYPTRKVLLHPLSKILVSNSGKEISNYSAQ